MWDRSEQYPDDESGWHGVGVYGSFTFDSPSQDVVEYVYTVLGSVPKRVRPEEPGGPATIRWMPESGGPYYMQVRAVDRAGRSSSETTYWMRVAEGRAPVAHWKLADPAGADHAAAEAGPAARAGSGVRFGAPAPSRTDLTSTVSLDGRSNSYLTPDAPATDTTKTFALSAWVRPFAAGTAMTVAGQDAADDTSAFTLGLRPASDSSATWAFRYGATTLRRSRVVRRRRSRPRRFLRTWPRSSSWMILTRSCSTSSSEYARNEASVARVLISFPVRLAVGETTPPGSAGVPSPPSRPVRFPPSASA